MSWTARQRAMLEAMGLRVWTPLPPAAGALDAAEVVETAGATGAAGAAGVVSAAGAAGVRAPMPAAPAHASPATTMPGREPPSPSAPPAALAPPARPRPPSPAPLAARPGAVQRDGIERLDWPALREAVAGCTACGLCEKRRHTVFGVGHEQAHWMIVGEAPGEQEDLRGEPFVGPAGQLLDAMLASIGLTRAPAPAARQVFIANTLKCRPPGNRNPTAQELAQCEPFLVRQVALVQPRIILAMGRFAVQSLLRSELAIGRLRGQVHRYEGVPLVVTYHPAYLLRQPLDKARAWEDLCLARAVAAGATATPGG